MEPLSQAAVRGVMIAAQGLEDGIQPPATKDDILAVIRQIHRLQLDSINVVARAPYFMLWSRLGDYKPQWLDELLAEGALFEYWSHAMCFLPIEDYPIYRAGSRILDYEKPQAWIDAHPQAANAVLEHIRAHGPTRAGDFKRDGPKVEWWDPSIEKVALTKLHLAWHIMVSRRENFQALYDLSERVYPDGDRLPPMSLDEMNEQMVLYAIHALGVAKTEWIAPYFRQRVADVNAALKRLKKQGRVQLVDVEGWRKPGYVHPDNLALVEAAADERIPRSKTTLLSPFDPLIQGTKRIAELFDFEYTIEFYFPEKQRRYGYYSLPILHDNALVGRLDPKAHRKDGRFEVKALHLEPGVEVDDALVNALRRTLYECAWWHGTPEVVVGYATDAELAEALVS